ncbi:MAG: hypothetical protein HY922_02645 [Elusimicrobia bacterium]|nr:hypothetical protein [Elusimicrobiota bacterium]
MAVDRPGNCHHCGKLLNAEDYARGTLCPGCRRETRCCRNCEFYSPSCNNLCREPQAELIVDKEKSNFCEFFRPRAGGPDEAPEERRPKPSAKAAFDALFKKKPK